MQRDDARNVVLKCDGNSFLKCISMPPEAKGDICLIL